MKILLFLFISLLVGLPLHAELRRKELVSYTLDYYATEITKNPPQAAENKKEKAVKQKLSTLKKSSLLDKYEKIKNKPIAEKKAEAKGKKRQLAKTVSTQEKKPHGMVIFFKNPSAVKDEKQISKALKPKVKETPDKIKNAQAKEPRGSEAQNRLKSVLKNIHPYLTIKEEYDDNIYRIKTDPAIDYITKIYPGIEYKSKTSGKKMDLYFNAGLESLKYLRTGKNSDRDTPYGRGSFRYGFGKLNFLTYTEVKSERSSASQATNEEIKEFVDDWRYEYDQGAILNLNKFNIETQYRHTNVQYTKDNFKSSNFLRDIISLRNSLKISPKTSVFMEYAHGWLNYHKKISSNWDYDKYYLGLKGRIFSKIEGLAKIGYGFTKQKSAKDINGNEANIGLNYRASPKLNYRLNFIKAIGGVGLITDNISKGQGISLGASYLPSFVRKLRLDADMYYWQTGSDYMTRNSYFKFTFKPEYRIKKWLTVGLRYQYEQNRSKTKSSEYKDNTIGLDLSSEF